MSKMQVLPCVKRTPERPGAAFLLVPPGKYTCLDEIGSCIPRRKLRESSPLGNSVRVPGRGNARPSKTSHVFP